MPRTGTIAILGYSSPELHTNATGWYIDYYAVHPREGTKRYRVKCNKPADLVKRKLRARMTLQTLTKKLEAGWRPWGDEPLIVDPITLGEAFDKWDRTKKNQLRHSSPYSYSSLTDILRQWVKSKEMLNVPAHAFNRSHAVDFLNYADEVRQIGNRTYNNYLTFFGMLFTWMKEQGMRSDQPFKDFTKRKKSKKTRTYLTAEDRAEMAQWIAANDPDFWLPVLFIYGALIRPGELRRLHVEHVDLEAQVVKVPAEESKSGDARTPAIPDWMKAELLAMRLNEQPGKAWLVGNEIKPGITRIARNTLGRRWKVMQKALGWSDKKQLYSLRDTGIIQLILDGVDVLAVKQQADHKSLATTNEYVDHAFPHGPVQVRMKATPLQASTPIIGVPMFRGMQEEQKQVPRFADMER